MKNKLRAALALLLLALLTASCALAACPTDEDHRYGPWKTKTSATCTRQGHQFKYCQKCDHWEQRRTPKLPHTLESTTVTKAPTCTAKGTEEGVCTVCGQTIRRSIAKLPHNYADMVETKAPTCLKSGQGTHTCADCGHVKRVTIERLGHDWGEMTVTKEPTCLKTGVGETPCTRCAQKQKTTLPKLIHVYGDWTVTQEPAGQKKGVRQSVCTLCGQKKTERFYPDGTLYEGMTPCEEVIRLQEMLRDLGYYNGSIKTGTFGQLTTTSVARFQRDNGLEQTGLADTTTRKAIESAWYKEMGIAQLTVPQSKTDSQGGAAAKSAVVARPVVTLSPAAMESAPQAQAL